MLEVLEVQVVLDDRGAHCNQCLVALLVPGVQEGQLLSLLLDPKMKRNCCKSTVSYLVKHSSYIYRMSKNRSFIRYRVLYLDLVSELTGSPDLPGGPGWPCTPPKLES